jgi:diacylglycerol kinase (ATP)
MSSGLVWTGKNETAFRPEIIVSFVLIVLSCYLDISIKEQAMLIISLLFVLFSETLNTAIEAVVDRIGYDYHELSGLAKDLASAAVFY